MKILFLDVDGVLNRCGMSSQGLEEDKCELLSKICQRTGCVIVVSSTWRWIDHAYERLQRMFHEYGIPHIGKTEVMSEPTGKFRSDGAAITKACPRHVEITEWLSRHPDVTSYAIVDDDPDADDQSGRYVATRSYVGLGFAEAEKLVFILNQS